MISRALFISGSATLAALLSGSALAALGTRIPAQERGAPQAERAGLVHVELALDTTLRLAWEAPLGGNPRLRLSGGAPGGAGMIAVESIAFTEGGRLVRPLVFATRFDANGTLVAELPAATAAVCARGLEFDSAVATPRMQLDGARGDESALTGDVHRALLGLGQDERVQLHLIGSARLGGLQAWVDTRLELERDGDELVLPATADEARLSFAGEAELARGIESVTLLRTFAGVETELEGARQDFAGANPGGGIQKKVAEPGDATPIPGEPHRAGDKKPLIPRKDQARPFDGPLQQGGDVVPDVSPAATPLHPTVDVLGSLDEPRPAGDKNPLPPRKEKPTKTFDGELQNGGSVGVPPVPAIVTTVDTLGGLDEPGRAGDKKPLPPSGKKQSQPSGPVEQTAPPRSVVILSGTLLNLSRTPSELEAAARALGVLRAELGRHSR